jgi:hypothetical protein
MIFNYINSLKAEESDEIIEDVYNSVFNSSIHHRFKNKNIINKVNIMNIYGEANSGKTEFVFDYFDDYINITKDSIKKLNQEELDDKEVDTIILDNYEGWFDSFIKEKNFILKLINNKITKQIKNIIIVTTRELDVNFNYFKPYKSYEDYNNMDFILRSNIYPIHISEILSLYNLKFNPNLDEYDRIISINTY